MTRFGIAAEVAGPASGYLRLLNWGTLPLLLYGATRRYLQGVGQVRVITVTYVLANLVNWFGNWVLIYGKLGFPALGVNGSAISTAFARVIMAAALLGFAWRYERGRGHPLFRHWAAPQAARLKRLLQLGAPAAGQILLEVGAWNLATLSAGYLTPVALATHQIVLNYASVTYMVPLGISAAAAVSVGHAVGAGDAARARRAGWMALGLGTSFMLLAALVFLLWPRPLIELFSRDPRVLAVGPGLLGIVAAFEIFDGIQTVSTGALRGLGETQAPMWANLVGYWVLGLPLGFFLCFGLVGNLRALDRADAGADRDCPGADGALAARRAEERATLGASKVCSFVPWRRRAASAGAAPGQSRDRGQCEPQSKDRRFPNRG